MTKKEKEAFLDVAKQGHACGLESPREWLANYLMNGNQFESCNEVDGKVNDIVKAYHQFFIESSSCPGEFKMWSEMSSTHFQETIMRPYNENILAMINKVEGHA